MRTPSRGETEVITLNRALVALNLAMPSSSGQLWKGRRRGLPARIGRGVHDQQKDILDETVALRTPSVALVRVLPMGMWISDGHRDKPGESETLLAYALEMNEHAVEAAEERGIAVVDPTRHSMAPRGTARCRKVSSPPTTVFSRTLATPPCRPPSGSWVRVRRGRRVKPILAFGRAWSAGSRFLGDSLWSPF